MFAGYQRSNERRKWFETVMQKEEGEDGTTLSHSKEPVRELNSTSLDSKESQSRDKKKSKDAEQRNVLKDNEEGVTKGN